MATSGYRYACSNASNYRNASSSGWLPINFQNISSGAPFGSLPVDPTNQSSSNLYYSYETNGSQYVLSSFMESQKYAKNMQTTGGIDPALYEIGSGVSTLPNASRGLVGYWPLNEGTGNSAIDWSGEGNNGTWSGTQIGTSGYYSPGKVFQWAGMFDGSSTKVTVSNVTQLINTSFTINGWMNMISMPGYYSGTIFVLPNGVILNFNTSRYLSAQVYNGSAWNPVSVSSAVPFNTWNMATLVYNNVTQTYALYLNGAKATADVPVPGGMYASYTQTGTIGAYSNYDNALISDVRLYDRALSASEVQQLYNAEK